MAKGASTGTNEPKRISLALQGGGSHGAFTWGALDRLLEDPGIEIAGICGTSAGAMNGTVLAYGLASGGRARARELLEQFWWRVSESAGEGLLRPTPFDKAINPGNLDHSPIYWLYASLARIASPYQLNPGNFHPLRGVLEGLVDFDALRGAEAIKLFVCATNVLSGRIKVFERKELSVDAVLASACLPGVFQAVEVAGQHYWDGGYMGNPPIYPLIYHVESSRDVLIIQINPIAIEEVPTTAADIDDRVKTLSWNSSLMREMRAINFVTSLVDRGFDDGGRLRRMLIHVIDAEIELRRFSASSKLNADWDWVRHLRDLGRAKADAFLAQHRDKLGRESSTDIVAKFL